MSILVWWLILFTIGFGPSRPVPAPTHLPQSDPAPQYSGGKATFYDPGLMERVAVKRGVDLRGASGFSTFPDCKMIGRGLMVSVQDPRSGRWSGWALKRVVDCSQPADYARHVAEGLIELSYQDAVLYGYELEGHTRIRWYMVPNK